MSPAAKTDTPSVRYVRNEEGGVHSVSPEHFDNVLHVTSRTGAKHLLPGWEEITEAEARKVHPQLFGAPDPNIYLSSEEAVRAAQREKALREIESGVTDDQRVAAAVAAALAAHGIKPTA